MKDMNKENEMRQFVREEGVLIKRNNAFKAIKNYVSDAWNLYDWISIILLIACIVTHIDDIRNHTEFKARLHIHIMSATVIVIGLRLLKSSRVLIPKFGTLVMILYYAISDMIIWFMLYMVIWLSFSKLKEAAYSDLTHSLVVFKAAHSGCSTVAHSS